MGKIKNNQISKAGKQTVSCKTLVGLSLIFSVIIAAFTAGLFILGMEIQNLSLENQNFQRKMDMEIQNLKLTAQNLQHEMVEHGWKHIETSMKIQNLHKEMGEKNSKFKVRK